MNRPMQAAPVTRGGHARAHQFHHLVQSSCNILSCGSKVISCASQCFPNPLNPGCIACLGSAWNDCKDCF